MQRMYIKHFITCYIFCYVDAMTKGKMVASGVKASYIMEMVWSLVPVLVIREVPSRSMDGEAMPLFGFYSFPIASPTTHHAKLSEHAEGALCTA